MAARDILADKTALPLIVAPMFLVSNPKMALQSCANGVVGSFPALNQRTAVGFEQWLVEMNDGIAVHNKNNPAAPAAPYAVNLIVHKSNPRLEEDLALCIKHRVPVIITSLGISDELIKKVQAYGGIVLHDVTNIAHAKKAAGAGVDGLIAVSAGAGGHAGTMNPLTLVSEIRKFYDGFLVLAGGLTNGADILTAQAMGADAAYMGTRFVATAESSADDAYKQMICAAQASDIVYTAAVSGVPANFLRQSLEAAGFDVEALKKNPAETKNLKSMNDEAKAWKTIWSAGHGVSTIDDVPSVADLVTRLKTQYAAARQAMAKKLGLGQKPPSATPPTPGTPK